MDRDHGRNPTCRVDGVERHAGYPRTASKRVGCTTTRCRNSSGEIAGAHCLGGLRGLRARSAAGQAEKGSSCDGLEQAHVLMKDHDGVPRWSKNARALNWHDSRTTRGRQETQKCIEARGAKAGWVIGGRSSILCVISRCRQQPRPRTEPDRPHCLVCRRVRGSWHGVDLLGGFPASS